MSLIINVNTLEQDSKEKISKDLEIKIEDRQLAELPVSGRLRIGEIDSMLEALKMMTNAEVQRVTPTKVVLSHSG